MYISKAERIIDSIMWYGLSYLVMVFLCSICVLQFIGANLFNFAITIRA